MIPASATSAPDRYLVGSSSSLFSISGLRVPMRAVLATVGLGLLVLLPTGVVTVWMMWHMHISQSATIPPLVVAVNNTAKLLTALLLIAWIGKGCFSDYGLQWPKGKSYVCAAIAWGTLFGILMTAVDYLPQILRRLPPPGHLALAPANIAAYLAAYGLYTGPSEEISFRGLMQTFLMQRTSGTVRLGRYEMHVAGVILALLFALAHITSFWQIPFWFALGQQVYAFALGILYAYWRERSESLLAPILGHSLGDGVEYALMFFLTWLWR
jgi:membrane protease YdiL (CAAX protease family)